MSVKWWPTLAIHEYDDQFSCITPGVDDQGRVYMMAWESWHDIGENGIIIEVKRLNDQKGYDELQYICVHDEFEHEEWDDLLKVGEEVEQALKENPEDLDLEAFKVERVL